MVTISHLVEKAIEDRPFIEEFLSRGLINYAALAEQMKPEIEKALKKEVKTSAVMMSLRRLANKLEKNPLQKAHIHFQESDIMMKSDLCEITFVRSKTLIKKIMKIYDLVDFSKGDFLTVTHGIYETTIVTNRKYKDKIEEMLPNEDLTKSILKLTSLTIKIPLELIDTVGMFYVITKALNWNNINILEIVSTLTELTFIIREDDVPRAFTTIQNLIRNLS